MPWLGGGVSASQLFPAGPGGLFLRGDRGDPIESEARLQPVSTSCASSVTVASSRKPSLPNSESICPALQPWYSTEIYRPLAARGIVGNAAARGRCTVTITVTPHPPDHDKWH